MFQYLDQITTMFYVLPHYPINSVNCKLLYDAGYNNICFIKPAQFIVFDSRCRRVNNDLPPIKLTL